MQVGDQTIQDEASTLPSTFIGSITRDMATATGTVAYTGIGFRPSFITFEGARTGGTETYSWGMTNGTLGKSMGRSAAGGVMDLSNTAILCSLSGPTTAQTAVLNSFDADGFTLDWTRIGVPTSIYTLHFAAFK